MSYLDDLEYEPVCYDDGVRSDCVRCDKCENFDRDGYPLGLGVGMCTWSQIMVGADSIGECDGYKAIY